MFIQVCISELIVVPGDEVVAPKTADRNLEYLVGYFLHKNGTNCIFIP
jgi:hypothetical protein